LDGETNLKNKASPTLISNIGINEETLSKLSEFKVTCQPPNDSIHKFEGTIENCFQTQSKGSLDYSNFLCRGSSLRNTDWIIGVVAYTGHETRIMMNSHQTHQKKSRLELESGRYILYIVLLQCCLCFIGALYETFWTRIYQSNATYLEYPNPDVDWTTWHFLLYFTKSFFTWILLFTNMVPISLLVTLEIVKFCQATFISWDYDMYDQEKNLETLVLTNNLNEELGQVSQIFSDKTGTLTCNVM
jgi:phospholipid-transporting ATPase